MSGFNNHPTTYSKTSGNSFAYFDSLLGSRQSRKIANNTYCQRREDGSIAIKLHATDVVTYHADGTVTLNSGGYETVTTKDRFNNFGPSGIAVYSDKGRWTVYRLPYSTNESAPFVSGMRFDPSPERFSETTAPYRTAGFDLERSRKATETKIRAFLADLTPETLGDVVAGAQLGDVVAGAQHAFGLTGDCLICRMEWTELRDASENGSVRKVKLSDSHHIGLHVAERYYFGTLLMNALVWSGYRKWQLPCNIGSLDTVKRSLRKYLRMRLHSMTIEEWAKLDSKVSE